MIFTFLPYSYSNKEETHTQHQSQMQGYDVKNMRPHDGYGHTEQYHNVNSGPLHHHESLVHGGISLTHGMVPTGHTGGPPGISPRQQHQSYQEARNVRPPGPTSDGLSKVDPNTLQISQVVAQGGGPPSNPVSNAVIEGLPEAKPKPHTTPNENPPNGNNVEPNGATSWSKVVTSGNGSQAGGQGAQPPSSQPGKQEQKQCRVVNLHKEVMHKMVNRISVKILIIQVPVGITINTTIKITIPITTTIR
eukprot:UN29848